MDLFETGAVMDILETAYPRYYAGVDDGRRKRAAEMWASAFADDDPRLVAAAVKSFINSDEKGFPPVPGQIRAKLRLIVGHNDATELEAWNLVKKALRNSDYYPQEEFDKLPPLVRRMVGNPAQLREWSLMDSDTVNSVIASNFQRSYREAAEREREYGALPPDVQEFADKLAAARKTFAPALKAAEKRGYDG